jgi:hypothetical protein
LLENSKLSHEQLQIIHDRKEFRALVTQSSSRRMSLARFSRLVLVLVFHFAVRDGRLPSFWRRMDHNLLVHAIRRDMIMRHALPDPKTAPYEPMFDRTALEPISAMPAAGADEDDGDVPTTPSSGRASKMDKWQLTCELMDHQGIDWLLVACHPDVGLQAAEYVKQHRMNVADAVDRAQREAIHAFWKDAHEKKASKALKSTVHA